MAASGALASVCGAAGAWRGARRGSRLSGRRTCGCGLFVSPVDCPAAGPWTGWAGSGLGVAASGALASVGRVPPGCCASDQGRGASDRRGVNSGAALSCCRDCCRGSALPAVGCPAARPWAGPADPGRAVAASGALARACGAAGTCGGAACGSALSGCRACGRGPVVSPVACPVEEPWAGRAGSGPAAAARGAAAAACGAAAICGGAACGSALSGCRACGRNSAPPPTGCPAASPSTGLAGSAGAAGTSGTLVTACGVSPCCADAEGGRRISAGRG